jgi:hypothetical protein
METIRRRTMIDRMRGAAMLDIPTYEEVETDKSATGQAAAVVAIVAVASAIGSYANGVTAIVVALCASLLGWLVWAGVTYLIGDKLLGGTATWGELLRTLGFAQAPGVLAVLGIIPGVGSVVRFVVSIWVLVAGVIAIRQALDFSTGKAIVTALLGWLVISIPLFLLGMGAAGRSGATL